MSSERVEEFFETNSNVAEPEPTSSPELITESSRWLIGKIIAEPGARISGITQPDAEKFLETVVYPAIHAQRKARNDNSQRRHSPESIERQANHSIDELRWIAEGLSYADIGLKTGNKEHTARMNVGRSLRNLLAANEEGYFKGRLFELVPTVSIEAPPEKPEPQRRVGRAAVRAAEIGESSNVEQSIDRDLTGMYLNEIGKNPLINAETEVELSKAIEAGQLAERVQAARAAENITDYLDQLEAEIWQEKEGLSKKPHQTIKENAGHIKEVVGDLARDNNLTDEELEWLIEEGQKAKNQFIQSNLRLVVSIAKRYGRSGMPLLDLIQEGNTGLIRAVEKFDYTKGWKFSTYATWWVRQAITRGIAQQSRVVRLPVHVHEELSAMGTARRALTSLLGREPEPEEIAEEMDMDVERVLDLMSWGREHTSLDAPVDEDGDTSLGDLISPDTAPGPDSIVLESDVFERLEALVDTLGERDADILRSRFGINVEKQKLADIGAKHGLSPERIRQIEKDSLKKLRRIADPDLAAS